MPNVYSHLYAAPLASLQDRAGHSVDQFELAQRPI